MATPSIYSLALALSFMALGSPQAEKKSPDRPGYRLAGLEVNGATAFPRERLLAEFPVRVGDPEDASRIKEGLGRIKRLFEEAGYIDFKFTPWIDIDDKAKTSAYSFDLWQGIQYLIHRINFAGSLPIPDSEIRSAMTRLGLEEGKTFRPSLLDEAVKNLNGLLGEKRLTSKDCAFVRLVDRPGMVDITIRYK